MKINGWGQRGSNKMNKIQKNVITGKKKNVQLVVVRGTGREGDEATCIIVGMPGSTCHGSEIFGALIGTCPLWILYKGESLKSALLCSSDLQPRSWSMFETLEVLCYLFRVHLAARLCTISIFWAPLFSLLV